MHPQVDNVIPDLGDAIFRDPANCSSQTADAYLSGAVRSKLATANAAATLDPSFARNVVALERVSRQTFAPLERSARHRSLRSKLHEGSLYDQGHSMQRSVQQIERIARWREAFRDDTTGTHKTVQDLLWNYAAFRTTVRIVRLANERREARPPLNQMLFNLISEGYWSGLLLGTRRLLDKVPLNGPKGVYSIRSVVKDVEASRGWLSRKNYVEKVLDAQYDLDRLRQENCDKLTAAKGGVVWGDPELIKSDAAHRHFDVLSGIPASGRSPDDLIDPAIFTRIEARLAVLDRIADHVSTHVAHAGNKESRLNKLLDDFDIRDAQKALKQMKEVADLTGVWFANEGGGGLATFIGDQFEGIDQPLIGSADIADLAEQWRAIDREVADWSIGPTEL